MRVDAVYRGGDCESTMPKMSAEFLQRELEFYQLPSLDELGLTAFSSTLPCPLNEASKKMMRQIMEEINESGLKDMFPWRVYIYYRFSTDGSQSSRGILVIPDAVQETKLDAELSFIKDRGHDEFVGVLNGQNQYYPETTFYPQPDAANQGVRFTLQTPTDDFVEIIRDEARGLGLLTEARNMDNWSNPNALRDFSFKELAFLFLRPLAH